MENEKLDLQVGDRVTYRFIDKDGIFTEIVSSSNLSLASIHWFKELLEDKEIEIIKIERPHYEVVEEMKELLTEDEKEFLKQYIKIIENLDNGKVDGIRRSEENIYLLLETGINYHIEIGIKFGNMKLDNKYTLEELGLEVN